MIGYRLGGDRASGRVRSGGFCPGIRWIGFGGPGRSLVLAAALVFAPPARATELIPRTLPEMAKGSDLIFVGRCEAISSHWNDDRSLIFTANRFRVLRALKGTPGDTITITITITELGGTVGADRLVVSGVPRFSVGEEVLLCVHRTPLGRWETFGAGQGRFGIVRDAQGRPWVRNDFYRGQLNAMSPDATKNGRAPLAVFVGRLQAMMPEVRLQ